MKNGIISIVDSEEEYAVRLAGFLSQKNGIGYEIQVFTDISSYMSFEEDSHSDILLISDVFGEFIPDLKNSGQIFILSGDTIDISLKDYIHIKKYQSSENILKSIMSELATQPYPKTKVILKDKKTKIICTYSPVKRCGKTTFSLVCGCILAVSNSTLYLNFEECSAVFHYTGTNMSGDLSDLLYFFRQNPANLDMKLLSLINSFNGLDFINPFRHTLDLKCMSGDNWCAFLNALVSLNRYDYIIIDISDCFIDIFSILSLADIVFLPILNDPISAIKLEMFLSNCKCLEDSSISDKLIKISLPEFSPKSDGPTHFLELLNGDYGESVKRIIQNEC